MDPLQQTFRRELSQIAPNGVLRERELLAQIFCDHLPGPPQDVEDVLFAMTGEHKPLSHGRPVVFTNLHGIACFILFEYYAVRSHHDRP
jgi:hypothetical protein